MYRSYAITFTACDAGYTHTLTCYFDDQLANDSPLGLNLGGQTESTAAISQDPSLAGAIDINPMSGSQNGDQQLSGLLGAGAEAQGQSADASQVFGGAQQQMQFNKKVWKVRKSEHRLNLSEMACLSAIFLDCLHIRYFI